MCSVQTESRCVIPNFVRTSCDKAAERLCRRSDALKRDVVHGKRTFQRRVCRR